MHQATPYRVNLSASRPPDHTWKRPHVKWTDNLRRDNNNIPVTTLWRSAVGRGHLGHMVLTATR